MQKEQKIQGIFDELEALTHNYEPIKQFAEHLPQVVKTVDRQQIKTLQEKYHYFLIKIHKYFSEHSKLKIDFERLNQTINDSEPVSNETKNILFVILGNYHIKNKTQAASLRVENLKAINNAYESEIAKYRQELANLKQNYFLLSKQYEQASITINNKQKQKRRQKAFELFQTVRKGKLRRKFLIRKKQQASLLKQNTNSTFIENSKLSNLRQSMSRFDYFKLSLNMKQRIYTTFNSIHTTSSPFGYANHTDNSDCFLPIMSRQLLNSSLEVNSRKWCSKQQFHLLTPQEILKQILVKDKLKQVSELMQHC